MIRNLMIATALLVAVCACANFAYAEELMVADFDSGAKPNNIGGNFGAWDKDPADFSQGCTDIFDPVEKSGSSGFSMKLDYDVDSPNPAYNGFWLKMNDLDASGYKNISFDIKGDSEEGYTTVFKIELKNNKGEVGKFYATGIDDSWQTIAIPLKNFTGIIDYSALEEFVIVFEDRMATNKDGIVYIDNIRLTN